MHESRLFRIIYYLLEKGKSTAPELAEQFEVSVRTVYRDIDILSGMGVPVYASQGKGGGIALLDGFVLDRSLLSIREKEQILMALQGITAAGHQSGELLTKLGTLFQTTYADWIEVDFSDWVRREAEPDIFNLMKHAIFSRNLISFTYYGSRGERMARKAEPCQLIFKSKAWYLHAYCLVREEFRFFKLTRIRELNVLTDTFERKVLPAVSGENRRGIVRTMPVTLKFERSMAFRVYDEFPDEVTEDGEGSLYVRTNLPDSDAVFSYLFSFTTGVEVIAPASLREKVSKKLAEMQNKYIT